MGRSCRQPMRQILACNVEFQKNHSISDAGRRVQLGHPPFVPFPEAKLNGRDYRVRKRFIQSLLASPLLLLFAGASASPELVWGTARAQDGDSMMVDGVRVRLFVIDAPELDQACTRAGRKRACGEEAAAELSRPLYERAKQRGTAMIRNNSPTKIA